MDSIERTRFEFPVGYHAFHRQQLFNFQLNRWYSLGYLPYDAMLAAGKKVSDFPTWTKEMRTLAERALERDELILTGRNDHFIPYKLHDRSVAILSHTRSLTDRVFTKAESAQNHCQIGNIGLAMDTMTEWMQRISLS